MRRFDSFVMFAEMRTGSNFLEANLNAIPGIHCYGEVFNPHFIGRKGQTSLLGIDMAARAADPLALLARLQAKTQGLAGFRLFHDHDARVTRAVLENDACAKIILTRNPVDSYVSLKIAQATGQWKLTDAKHLKSGQARFDGPEFDAHLADLQAFQVTLLHQLQVTGQTAFYIDYEDIQSLEVLNGLAAFLGVEGRLAALDASLKKQNPEDIGDKVANLAEMAAALARLDRFNLARTPNFEPRRGPMVPGFVAAGGLLYMPIPGCADDALRQWLAKLGPLTTDFTQQSLKQWKRKGPRHRSFTLLQDPLARAEAAFRSRILTGARADVWTTLQKVHAVDLPDPGKPFDSDEAYQAALLGFLQFIKLNLGGQTGLKVDAHWASQSAILQGFAQFQAPDLVLRPGRVAEGLQFLAAEIGRDDCPALAPEAPPPSLPASLHDIPELRAAARDAYARDYLAFGW
jgi:LPS sulfotransferase NodH